VAAVSAQLEVGWLAGAVLLLVMVVAFLAAMLRSAVLERRQVTASCDELLASVRGLFDEIALAEAEFAAGDPGAAEEPAAPPGGA
jgi:hypothetical protein